MNVGDKIPEILGSDQNGRLLTRADFAGRKLVLYSYPKANTPGCTAEACSLQAHLAELSAAGYAVVGVSKDKEALQKKFADAQGLEFPLIADVETTLLQALGCWGEKVACGRRTIGTLRTPYPTTTTSSRKLLSSARTTSYTEEAPSVTVYVE